MTVIDALGWAAAGMTMVTYAMRTMVPLRIAAIAASALFLVYAFLIQNWPLLVMDMILLPFNCWRLRQILVMQRKMRLASASDAIDLTLLRQIGAPTTLAAGATIFRQGDPPDHLYVLERGRVELEELGITLSENDLFGEIAFFTEARARTATARCLTECQVYAIDENAFLQLYFLNPGFAMALMKLVIRRVVQNVSTPPPSPRPEPAGLP